MSNYPRDEFDDIEENSARYGIHRVMLAPRKRSLVPLMIFGVVALCIGALAFFYLPKVMNNSATPPPAAVSSSAPVQTAAQETPTPEPTTEAPVETHEPTPTPAPTPESVVNKTIPVSIFNAVGTPGLAGRYAGLVQADGWTVAQSANWSGQPQGTSSIYYNGITEKANAEALGTLLNIHNLLDTPDLGVPLAIVLGPGA